MYYLSKLLQLWRSYFLLKCVYSGGGGGGGGKGESGGGQVYFLQLYVDLDGNHKNFKNHQNKKAKW